MQRSWKSARSGEQKPVRIQRRMKAKIFCLSLALENPHQALDAYMSLRRRLRGRYHAVSRRTTHACAGHAVRTDYRVCAQAAMTLCTCNVTDRLLVNITPRILIICTRWSSGISSEIENFVFRLNVHITLDGPGQTLSLASPELGQGSTGKCHYFGIPKFL